jgi:hypothetical protein
MQYMQLITVCLPPGILRKSPHLPRALSRRAAITMAVRERRPDKMREKQEEWLGTMFSSMFIIFYDVFIQLTMNIRTFHLD